MARKEKPTTKLCKHCKTEIPYEASVCPQCRKKQKTGCLGKILIAIAVLFVLLMFSGGEPEEELAENEFVFADMKVAFLEHKVEKDAAGTKCLVLYFDFTNNADESYAFDYTFMVKAFQDGVEIQPTYFHVNEETKNGSKEIEPGMTLRVAEQYEIKDVSGKIEIEIEPFNIWSDKTLFTYEFNLD